MSLATNRRRPDPWAERCMDFFDNAIDGIMTYLGPVFVILAILLISMCVWSFHHAVFGPEFLQRTSGHQRFMHGLVGSWVSFNIFFNYLMCVRTQAGSTASVNNQDLLDAHPPPERWCTTCEKPKPALSHHCSVCGVCVLCMDHHCPWVNRCVGFYNYRYFYLFLFWLTIGCGWAAPVFINRYGYRIVPRSWGLMPRPESMEQVHAAHRFTSILALMLTCCVVLVIGGMLLWHTYLVLSAQGTIDFQKNRMAAYYASAHSPWTNIFHLGMVRNWQERFNVRGRLWWLLWCLPRLAPPRGNGYEHAVSHTAMAQMTSQPV